MMCRSAGCTSLPMPPAGNRSCGRTLRSRSRTRAGRPLTLPSSALIGVGVDIVELGRLRRGSELSDLLSRRVLTSSEQAWCAADGSAPTRLATCIAVKEAAIKVIGGRPSGFDWRHVGLVAGCAGRVEVGSLPTASRALAAALPTLRWEAHQCTLSDEMLNGWSRCAAATGVGGWRSMTAVCGFDDDIAVAVIVAGLPGIG